MLLTIMPVIFAKFLQTIVFLILSTVLHELKHTKVFSERGFFIDQSYCGLIMMSVLAERI